MPVLLDLLSPKGDTLVVAKPAIPKEFGYVNSYFRGELISVIGAQCLQPDVGAVIHLVQDPNLILAINSGESIRAVLGEETAAAELTPGDNPIELPFTSKKGYVGKVAIKYSLPDSAIFSA